MPKMQRAGILKVSGKIRRHRSDSLVRTIERKYKVDLDVRSDVQLATYLKKKGYPSLSKMIQDVR